MSLALYQEAIHRLLRKLHTKDIAIIASCVVLSYWNCSAVCLALIRSFVERLWLTTIRLTDMHFTGMHLMVVH